MPQRKVYRLLIPLVLVIIAYFMMNPLLLALSYFWGDYPGPTNGMNITAQQSQKVGWLMIHGASADARVWKPFAHTHCGQAIVAITLGNQELSPAEAKPGTFAGLQLADFLATYPVQTGIVTHSTGSLWLAQAYHECPECLKNLKIILLAPSTGNNAIGLTPSLRTFLLWGSILAPDPYASLLYSFGIETTSACQGGDENDYPACRAIYMYGRKLLFTSFSYYQKLTDYMLNPDIQNDFKEFLKQDAKNITIYIPGDDKILFYDGLKQLAAEDGIPVITIPNISHEMILAHASVWFADKPVTCPNNE